MRKPNTKSRELQSVCAIQYMQNDLGVVLWVYYTGGAVL